MAYQPRMTDPVSGRKMRKGQPVPNAPGPDSAEIAAGTARNIGRSVGSATRKVLSYTPDIPAPHPSSPLGQLKSSLDDLSGHLSRLAGQPGGTAPPPSSGPGSFKAALSKRLKAR